MTWFVRWKQSATATIMQLIADDPVPPRIKEASDWVDYTLRRIPRDVGESREGNYRLWYTDVLGIAYRVDDASSTVTVMAVQLAKRSDR